MEFVNCWAVIVSAIAAFILGGIWYSPKVFGNMWRQDANINPVHGTSKYSLLIYIIAFAFFYIAAYAFAMFIGPAPELNYAVMMGFVAGFGIAATSFGINYAFANRGLKLFLIDGGYHTAQFVLYGIILGLWH